MQDIFIEIQSQFVNNQRNLVVNKLQFETMEQDLFETTLWAFENIKISPNKEDLRFEGKLKNLRFSKKNKQDMKETWQRNVFRKLVKENQEKKFLEKYRDEIEVYVDNTINNLIEEREQENGESTQTSAAKIFEENTTLGTIVLIFDSIFKGKYNVYNKDNQMFLWAKDKEFSLTNEDLNKILMIARIIKNNKYKFDFSILPDYDYSDEENEDVQGVSITLNIFYK